MCVFCVRSKYLFKKKSRKKASEIRRGWLCVCRKRDRDLDYIFIGKYFGFSSIAADGGMGGGQRVIVIQFR